MVSISWKTWVVRCAHCQIISLPCLWRNVCRHFNLIATSSSSGPSKGLLKCVLITTTISQPPLMISADIGSLIIVGIASKIRFGECCCVFRQLCVFPLAKSVLSTWKVMFCQLQSLFRVVQDGQWFVIIWKSYHSHLDTTCDYNVR